MSGGRLRLGRAAVSVSRRNADVVFLFCKRYDAGGENANAPMAGGTDQFKHNTRAKVA